VNAPAKAVTNEANPYTNTMKSAMMPSEFRASDLAVSPELFVPSLISPPLCG
jgi:hypothetical protein